MNLIARPLGIYRAARAFARLVQDPNRLDEVFSILDTLEAGESGKEMGAWFVADPRFTEALRARPRMGKIDLAALAALPLGTLGRTFADEMIARNLDPKAIQLRPDDGTPEGYVFEHLRETHDIWHTATGFEVDVAGELGLQAFYLSQFPAKLSMLLLSLGFLHTFFLAPDDAKRRMDAITRGWELGRGATMFGFDWAAHWETPLDEVRRKLGIVMTPDVAPAFGARGPSDLAHAAS